MRPAKRILLAGENEDALSLLRYTLRNARPGSIQTAYYSVTTATTAQAALDALKVAQYDLLLCRLPLASLNHLAARAHSIDPAMPCLVLTEKKQPQFETPVDGVLCAPHTAELLERIRVTITRKRGPRPGFKKPVSPEAFTLGAASRTEVA
jgi:DNA-binding response OmpR family regulator